MLQYTLMKYHKIIYKSNFIIFNELLALYNGLKNILTF